MTNNQNKFIFIYNLSNFFTELLLFLASSPENGSSRIRISFSIRQTRNKLNDLDSPPDNVFTFFSNIELMSNISIKLSSSILDNWFTSFQKDITSFALSVGKE